MCGAIQGDCLTSGPGYLGPAAATTDAYPCQYWCPRSTDTYLWAGILGDIAAVDGTCIGNCQSCLTSQHGCLSRYEPTFEAVALEDTEIGMKASVVHVYN